MATFIKDPDAVLDYVWDWSEWLDSGDTISTATTTADDGITVDSTTVTGTNTTVTVTLSGGTEDQNYDVTVHITTANGLEEDRTLSFAVRER